MMAQNVIATLGEMKQRAKQVLTNRDYWEGYEAAMSDAIKTVELSENNR